jgi:predicted Zn-dependent protease
MRFAALNLAGDFLNKNISLIVSAAVPAIFACAISVSQVAAQGITRKSERGGSSNCALVNNATARDYCYDAREQYNNHYFRTSLISMRKALAASPKEGIIRVLISRVMIRLGDEGAAEHELRQARKDGAPDHFILPALFDLMVSRHEESQLLSEFVEPPPGAKGDVAADILFGRAKARLSLGQLHEAAAAMDRSLGLRRDVLGLVGRAEIATRQNDKVLAAKLVDEAYELDPANSVAAFAKLRQIQSFNDTAKTLAFSELMLNLFPNRVDVRVVRIETFLKLRQDNKAKVEVDALDAKAPQSHFVQYYKALLLARANDKPGAWAIMQTIPLQFIRQNPSLAIPMAQLAIDNGHVDVGAAVLTNALSGAPDLLDTRLQLADLMLRQGSPQAALVVLTPVQDARDPQVQKLLAAVRDRISKDRGF